MGITIGKHRVNITHMQVGQEKEKKQNVILLTTDSSVSNEVLEEIRASEHIYLAKRIEL